MSARVAGRRVPALRAQLSVRDEAVLADLHRVRLLSATQVERLHFREGAPHTRARRCRRRLQALTDTGLLYRFERRIGGVRAGSAGYVYALTPAGQSVVGVSPRIRKPWEVSAPFLRHLLTVSELYVQLREAENLGRLELLTFEAEPACWRDNRDGLRMSVLKPDAFVQLGIGDYDEHAFIEVDLGTESQSVIARKAVAYRAYYQTGREQARAGVFPRVVFLTDRPERATVLARTVMDADDRDLFRVGRLERAPDVLLGEDEQGEQVTGGTNE